MHCPECGSKKVWRAGLRYLAEGRTVQRWLCRECGYRFSEKKSQNLSFNPLKTLKEPFKKLLNSSYNVNNECQVCEALTEGMKNLIATEHKQTVAGELHTTIQQNVKGKILEFAWYLKKNGFADSTIKRYIQSCNTLTSYGADILDLESVKGTIAKQKWQNGTKLNYVNFYNTFTKFLGLKWQKPYYRKSAKLPFIPLESEIDLLIHGTGKKISTTLHTIKETGMRIGEAMQLRWINIDSERTS